ncbi:hypothetical protein HMPREF0501_01038 [Limosilactobacillus coleohominis 101-4-CHN]|uniref:DUF2785 domain-containing protein n=1 Tax=Limosilactobacillus coleohominis 101-4-CHN TaxID=575594 RepID=C7XWN5_9LACO|nr:DUF2785 domain-containing protein [Limosilactobacillus coleohominis]EEU30033.1 hypothetical protein HMPREF0501_01038 [Limosilactobacillus coleohominis 101-4-CHN]
MVKRSITEVQTALVNLHQQLVSGEIYLDAIPKIDSLIENVKHESRTPVEIAEPEHHDQQILTNFVSDVQAGQHPQVDAELINVILKFANAKSVTFRRMILVTVESALENNLISTEQLKTLFHHFSQPDILLAHIDQATNQAAFGRSIAVNILRLILIADRSGYFFLTQDDISSFLNVVGLMAILERDTRGFVEGVGWVHLFTGMANLNNELAEHDELVRGDKIFLMATLVEGYKKIEHSFSMGENEDVANFLLKLFQQHQLYQDFFIEQLKVWRSELNSFNPYSKVLWVQLFNYRHLMQSLIIDGNLPEKVMKAIVTD